MEQKRVNALLLGILVVEFLILGIFLTKIFTHDPTDPIIPRVKRIDRSDWYGDGKHMELAERADEMMLSEHPDYAMAVMWAREEYENIQKNPDASPQGMYAEARTVMLLGSALLSDGRWNNKKENLVEGFELLKKGSLNEQYSEQMRSRMLQYIIDTYMTGMDDQLAKEVIFTGKDFEPLLHTPGWDPVLNGIRELSVRSAELHPYPISYFRAANFYGDELLLNEKLTAEERAQFQQKFKQLIDQGKIHIDGFSKNSQKHRIGYMYYLLAGAEAKLFLYTGGPTEEQIAIIDEYYAKGKQMFNSDEPRLETRWLDTLLEYNLAQWYLMTDREDKTASFFNHILAAKNEDMKKRLFDHLKTEQNHQHDRHLHRIYLPEMMSINAQFTDDFIAQTEWYDVAQLPFTPELFTVQR